MYDAVILAAGCGARAAADVPKQYLELAGVPVIVRALRPFISHAAVARTIVAAPQGMVEATAALLERHGVDGCRVVEGGATRQQTMYCLLEHVETPRMLSHNAALPFVTAQLIDQVISHSDPCVTTVTPMPYALCRGGEFATEYVDTSDLKIINTPQVFETSAIRDCHRRAREEGYQARTDCELMLRYGYTVRFVSGLATNFKITTPLDVVLAEALARRMDSGQ